MYGIHRASSKSWGEEQTARLCQIILESNNSIAQQVCENKTDLLDLLSLEELGECDDIGLSIPFLAVYYDRPDILDYVHRRGMNLALTCDPMSFGSPMFYAVTLRKYRIVDKLDLLGYGVNMPCDYLNQTASVHAKRLDDKEMIALITNCAGRENRALEMLTKNLLRIIIRKRYHNMIASIYNLQRVFRGILARRNVKKLKIRKQRKIHLNANRNEQSVEEYDEDMSVHSTTSSSTKSFHKGK